MQQEKIWSHEAIRAKLQHHNLRAVAKASGVKYQTVLLFMKHEERDPSYSTIKALSDYLDGK